MMPAAALESEPVRTAVSSCAGGAGSRARRPYPPKDFYTMPEQPKPSHRVLCFLAAMGALACGQASTGAPSTGSGGTETAAPTSGTGTTGGSVTGGSAASTGTATTAGSSSSTTGDVTATTASGGTTAASTGASDTAGTDTAGVGTGMTGFGGAATTGDTSTGAGGTGMSSTATTGVGGPTLPPTTDYAAAGPCETTIDTNTGPGGGYTIYRPETLGEDGFLHAPIVFGPGIGMQASQLAGLLTAFASHCFVVVGTPVLEGGPNDPGNLSKMRDGLDWIIEQNTQPGIYEGKLYVDHAVSMGYSVGGTAAVELGGHEAVATTVSIHGHIAESDMHGPLLQTSALGDTVGLPMQRETFAMSQVQTFLGIITDGDHGYIQANNGGAQRPAIIAWLRYWIYNDTGGREYFYGDDCVMCSDPWESPERKNWQ